ncbi:uncharacterized protein N7484_010037 [Penicillium longicatenatum]|uniref:uncharacterized protein n=1 Tax=Penicillium longicatenatum TaxID=1561947 RepID=UPI0025482A53|nr:uncharacterized protein N7484_010037 [Penicillium longicatenatum]KAJ5636724.1 hypothetical protein N7484_010037 [Penicillium longicatenatum]
MGAQVILAPFSQATQFYHSQEATDKHRWCQAVFMVLPRLGFGIAPFMKDIIWPKYEAATKKSPTTSPQSQGDESEAGNLKRRESVPYSTSDSGQSGDL